MRNPHVLVIVPFREHHMEALRAAAPEASFTQAVGVTREELATLLSTSDVVVGEPPVEYLPATPVRWVQMTWAGSDMYTRAATPWPSGITLTNVAGAAYGHTISQYVMGQVLALMQNLPTYVRQQEREVWQDVGEVASLEGACVLIFGTGDIGTCTARRLTGFETKRIVGVCRNTSAPREGFTELVALDEAEEWLPRANVVINCLPNTPETQGYLCERRLRMMREGSVLVNVGRGNFVDCDALARILAEGAIRGAALDVTNPEPLPPAHPLWHEPRCVITPHASGGAFGKSAGTENRICAVTCDNLRHFVHDEPLEHVVL